MTKARFITLRTRLLMAGLPLVAGFMLFNFTVIQQHQQETLLRETGKRGASLATGLSWLSAEALVTRSSYLLDQHVSRFGELPDVSYCMVLDPQGEVLAHTRPEERGRTFTDEVTRRALGSPGELIQPSPPDAPTLLDFSAPIQVGRRKLGVVRIGLGLDSMQDALSQSRRYLAGLTLVLVSGAVLFAGSLTRWFTQPLLRLAEVARDLARGDLRARAETSEADEVGLLGLALNHTASRLERLVEKEQLERRRLQTRVHALLAFTERVMAGALAGQAPVDEQDDLGQLTMAVNQMVRHLRSLLEEERAVRADLERSKQALETAHAQLKEVDRLKSEFLNTVSHELRTPLTSIKAFAEILLDGQDEDRATRAEFLEIINKEADRLTRLINNLLDLGRIEAGQMRWDFQEVDLHEIVTSATATLRAAAEKKELSLECRSAPGLRIQGDRDKLVQVLTNLIGNAIKFTRPGGAVRVHARTRGRDHEVTVSDTGIGIPARFHQTIFERFGRVDSSETREIKGTGLGLSIAHSIVEAHGGRLRVESREQEGSTFQCLLPALEAEPDGAPGPPPAPPPEDPPPARENPEGASPPQA